MKTQEKNHRNDQDQALCKFSLIRFCKIQKTRFFGVLPFILLIALSSIFAHCKKGSDEIIAAPSTPADQYTISQAISDEAQRNTISFDGLAFLTGNLGSQSFLPPGKKL